MTNLIRIKFKNFITLQRGVDLPRKDMNVGPYPVIGSTSIIGYHDEYKVEPPGVITGRSGSLGFVQYIREKYWPHNTALWVKDFKENQPRYVYYFLQTLDLQRFNSGAGVPTLNRNDLDDLDLAIHPAPVQDKIASILSAYDDLIENNNRRIKILEEMAQAIYKEWFVNFRFPGYEKVKMVKSELGMIPEGWKITALEDVCHRITDGSHFSPASVSDGLPMASVKDMHDWGFDMDGCRKVSEEDYEQLVRNDCRPLKNDVLIAKDGSYLKHAFVVEDDMNLVILSSIAILRPNNKMQPHFLSMHLKEPQVKSRLTGYVSGVAIPRIVLKDFRRFQVLYPPKHVQDKWATIVGPMIKGCWRLIDKNRNLRISRDLLLPKLISGEIDVEEIEVNI